MTLHKCSEGDCPCFGQQTTRACSCHCTDEQVLTEQRNVLLKALEECRRAIGDHFAPNDCYATGPLTGDHFRDLVQCPACSAIAAYDAAIAKAGAA